jgi:hypothetical protein
VYALKINSSTLLVFFSEKETNKVQEFTYKNGFAYTLFARKLATYPVIDGKPRLGLTMTSCPFLLTREELNQHGLIDPGQLFGLMVLGISVEDLLELILINKHHHKVFLYSLFDLNYLFLSLVVVSLFLFHLLTFCI